MRDIRRNILEAFFFYDKSVQVFRILLLVKEWTIGFLLIMKELMFLVISGLKATL